jgi:N-acetylglucosaminyldiphosphoundecaprenol N-acetyl-beta-D-mannosaminyltransferase
MISNHPLGHVKITSGSGDDVLRSISESISNGEKRYCVPLNLTKYVLSQTDAKLRQVIQTADYVIADGVSMVWLSRRARLANVCRVSGIDLSELLIREAASKGWKLFFFGASPENLEAATRNFKDKFLGLNVVGTQHGYFRSQDTAAIVAQINHCHPDIVLLGLGLPQKEYFIHENFSRMSVGFCLPVGGAFDIWAGAKPRTPRFIQKAGFEWLNRSLYDVSRARLIMKYGAAFAKELLWYRS